MSFKRKAADAALNDSKKSKKDSSITSFFGAPKTVSTSTKSGGTNGAAAAPISKFNKEKWVSTLTAEQKELLKLEIDTLHESWLAQLKEEVVSREFLDLKRFLKKEIDSGKKVFPPLEDVYSWSRFTPLNTVKAVILGQDPYHNVNQAHGLCFSVRPPTPAPPSLKNIYTCLKKDYPNFVIPPNKSGDLTPWATHGVLLLNTCLTVRIHEANSHANRGWEKFTQKVIDTVAKTRTKGVVFLAWGTPAAKRVVKVDKKMHCVLNSVHPSPLSASRGWFDCGHFKKTNEWLRGRYGVDGEIDWSLDPKKANPSGDKKEEDEVSGEVLVDKPDDTELVEVKAVNGKIVEGKVLGAEDDADAEEEIMRQMAEEENQAKANQPDL